MQVIVNAGGAEGKARDGGVPVKLGMVRMKAAKDVSKALSRVRTRLASREMRVPEGGKRRAAVLVPLFLRRGELHILFTRRARTLTRHKGQNRYSRPTDRQTDGRCAAVDDIASLPTASPGEFAKRGRTLLRQH